MDLSSAIRRGHPAAFSVFIVLSLIVAIIASAVVADFNKNGQPDKNLTRDSTRFMVFTGWWSVLFGAIYLALFVTGIGGVLSSIASHAIFVILTWIFWLAGTAALSNAVGGTSCSNTVVNNEIVNHPPRDCDSLKAIVAFGWITWIELTLMAGVICYLGFKAFRGGRGVQEGFA